MQSTEPGWVATAAPANVLAAVALVPELVSLPEAEANIVQSVPGAAIPRAGSRKTIAKNDIVTCIARRADSGISFVDLGRAEAGAAGARAGAARDVPLRRSRAGFRHRRAARSEGPADRLEPRLGQSAHQALRDGGAGDR